MGIRNLGDIVEMSAGFVVAMTDAVLRLNVDDFFEFILMSSKRTVLLTSGPRVA